MKTLEQLKNVDFDLAVNVFYITLATTVGLVLGLIIGLDIVQQWM